MESSPLVSVVIPNYNYGRYLAQAIESVLGQSYPNVEVLVVDDGSMDDSSAVLQRYAHRVRWFQQQRQGVSAARNCGIRESRGEFIAFLDADDVWHPQKLARQMAQITHPAIGLVCCGLQCIDTEGRLLGISVAGRSGNVLKEIALLRWPGAPGLGSTAVIRKACFDRIGMFDVELSTSADWDLWRRLSCHYDTAMVHESLVSYRVHHVSMHRNVDLFKCDMLRAFTRMFADPDAAEIHPLRRQCYGHLYLVLSGSYFHAGQWGKSLAYALRSLLIWPPSLLYLLTFPIRRLRHLEATRIGDRASHLLFPRGSERVSPHQS